MNEPEDRNARGFWRAVGEGIAMAFERSPNFASRSDEAGWLVRAGEAWIDFNCSLVFPGPTAKEVLQSAAAEFREHGLPFLVCIVKESQELRDLASRLGLSCAGPLPLMVLVGNGPAPNLAPDGLRIVTASEPHQFREVGTLSYRCFGISPQAIERVMPFDRPTSFRLRTLVAYRGDEPVASVTYSMQETGVGIWSMMTLPELRRQGIARALMLETIARARRECPGPIFLVSTPDGKPLYDRLGFETIDVGSVWTGKP